MKAFWKVLGVAALAAGLTPYKVEKNEETGESSYQALLWKGTIGPGEGEDKKKIDINLGFNPPAKKAEEPHLFSDELSVEYAAPVAEAVEEIKEEAAEAVEEAVEATEDAVEAVTEAVAEAVETEEPAEPEEPKAE